jgi:GNAT superfamily N-acetyltransferase
VNIRPYSDTDQDAVVHFSLRAWAPVFESLEGAMDPAVFRVLYPDWRVSQRAAIEAVLANPDQRVWVADNEGALVGFVSVILHANDSMGEIYMLAVAPEHQRTGVGTALTNYAVEWIRQAGMAIAMIGTGGDPGHAPARRTYERAGFRPLPLVQFYKKV